MVTSIKRSSIVGLLALACAGCGGQAGVLVQASWPADKTADSLLVVSRVNGGAPESNAILGTPSMPLASPYRVQVLSPPGEPVDIELSAIAKGQPFAVAHLGVTPSKNEILEVSIELEPVP